MSLCCLDLGYFQAHNEGLDEAKAREVPPRQALNRLRTLARRREEYVGELRGAREYG